MGMTTLAGIRPRALALALALVCGAPAAAAGGPCRAVDFEGRGHVVCEVAAGDDLRLFLTARDGAPLGTFDRLRGMVEDQGLRLVFAMNAGMYHPDRRPVGLYLEAGREVAPLVRAAGPGNFGMRPNGVFCIREDGFSVTETLSFDASPPACRDASQSGPMLVIGGALHPRFLADATSRHIRNGVGVSADGQRAVFAISDAPVTFHEFARLFRDRLGTPDALYLDGRISRLYAPGLGRDDFGFPMGPMVGLVARPD